MTQKTWNKHLSEKEFNEIGKLDQLVDENSYEIYSIHKEKEKKRKRIKSIWNKHLSEKEFNEIGKLDQLVDENSYKIYSIHKRYFVLLSRIEKGMMKRNNTSTRFSNSKHEFQNLCKEHNLPNPWQNS